MDEPIADPEKLGNSRAALLVKVWDDGEAEMIRQILLDYGIPSSVQSDVLHTLFPLRVDGLGEIRVFVAEERLAEAKEFLAEHRRQGLEIVGERDDGENVNDGADSDERQHSHGREHPEEPDDAGEFEDPRSRGHRDGRGNEGEGR